jgi:hypothetical protein
MGFLDAPNFCLQCGQKLKSQETPFCDQKCLNNFNQELKTNNFSDALCTEEMEAYQSGALSS